MSDLWAMIIVVGAIFARLGGLVLAVGAGRARFAATAAWRSLAELALLSLLTILLAKYLVPHLTSVEVPLSYGLAGTLLGAVLLSAAAGERSMPSVSTALSLIYALILVPAGYLAIPYLTDHSFIDRAAASMYILPAGIISLVSMAIVGPRSGRFARDGSIAIIPPHQLPMVLIGLLMVATGWILVASILSGAFASGPIHLLLALSAGVLGGAAYSRYRFGRTDVGLIVPAVFGALAAVTVGLGAWTEWQSLLAGLIGGVTGTYFHLLLERKLKLDDLTGAAAAQLSGVLTGLLLAPFFALNFKAPSWPGFANQLLVQLAGLALFSLLALLAATLILLLLKVLTPVRLSEELEYDGLDLAHLDLNAYPDFQQPTIRSSHMREV